VKVRIVRAEIIPDLIEYQFILGKKVYLMTSNVRMARSIKKLLVKLGHEVTEENWYDLNSSGK